MSADFSPARYAMVREQSLEREFRLAPSTATRNEHAVAARDMVRALGRARATADASGRSAADATAWLHDGALADAQRQFVHWL